MNRYWAVWFILAIPVGLGIPEITALLRRRPQDTLSYAVWKLEHFKTGQDIWHWNFAHLAFVTVFGFFALWLIGHFGWGLWR